jgi:histidine triad (HIT) family protein
MTGGLEAMSGARGNPPSDYTSRMADTIFSKIIAGEIPCHRVYEDEHVLAFLDIAPLSPGHTLVVPKEPAETLADLSTEAAARLGAVLPRLCRAISSVTGASAYNVLVNNGEEAGQLVRHVHVHIIPKIGDAGLAMRWPTAELDAGAARALTARIAAEIAH